jgi:DNA-binding transcriptional MerR regulator
MTEHDQQPSNASGGLSIGEAARLAGVTTRAVRHYHAVGLLPAPGRDSSGYRRYGAADLIALVRVTRLRALGVPIARIAERMGPDDQSPLTSWIDELADEIDAEIARLAAMRDTLRSLADTHGLDTPGDQLADALRAAGSLGTDEVLAANEFNAAGVVDALHPRGIAGALDDANELLTDPSKRERFSALVDRFRALTDESSAAERDQLAADFATLLPRSESGVRSVDPDVVERLTGARLSDAQRDVLRRMRVERAR